MAFTCGFYNSMNHDRKYDADQLSAIFDGIIKDGVFDSIGKMFSVEPNTQVPGRLAVTVNTGRAWFDHTWNDNNAPMPLQIEAADVTLKRYDAVILEVNHTDPIRMSSIKIKKGIPASDPKKPAMIKTNDISQRPFAYVLVRPGATSIILSDIENVVGRTECPFVTGILESADISDLFNQWQGDFDTWFQNIKDQLSGDVASNLQRQIDERVQISDKATEEEATEGGDDTKWMTPQKTRFAIKNQAYQVGDIRSSSRHDINTNEHYMHCDGRALSKAAYPELFDAIGSKYGTDFTPKVTIPNVDTINSTNNNNANSDSYWKSVNIKVSKNGHRAYTYYKPYYKRVNVYTPDNVLEGVYDIDTNDSTVFFVGDILYELDFDPSGSEHFIINKLSNGTKTRLYYESVGMWDGHLITVVPEGDNAAYMVVHLKQTSYSPEETGDDIAVFKIVGDSISKTRLYNSWHMNMARYIVLGKAIYFKDGYYTALDQMKLIPYSSANMVKAIDLYGKGYDAVVLNGSEKVLVRKTDTSSKEDDVYLITPTGVNDVKIDKYPVKYYGVRDLFFGGGQESFDADGNPVIYHQAEYKGPDASYPSVYISIASLNVDSKELAFQGLERLPTSTDSYGDKYVDFGATGDSVGECVIMYYDRQRVDSEISNYVYRFVNYRLDNTKFRLPNMDTPDHPNISYIKVKNEVSKPKGVVTTRVYR